MPVGPLAVTDEVSLELVRHAREQTKADFAAEGKTVRCRTPASRSSIACSTAGRKGKTAGSGFYEYPKDGKKHLWPGLRDAFSTSKKIPATPAEFAELQDRLLYIQSIETVRCLAEKVLSSVPDANIGSIFGIGAPAVDGRHAPIRELRGLREFVSRARELAKKHGARFEPPALLDADGRKYESKRSADQ